jgi:hypothetical protein
MCRNKLVSALAMATLAAILVPATLSAQTTFERTYGGSYADFGRSAQQTVDGGYIIAGETKSFGAGSFDVHLIKTDSTGDALWTRTFGGDTVDVGACVQQTVDGGYVVAGWTQSFGAGGFDVYLVKTDANGDTLWTRTFGGTGNDISWSVQQTADSGYIIAGGTESYGAGSKDVFLIKTDANGDTLWTRTIGGSDEDEGRSVQQTTDGGYIVAGTTYSFGAGDGDIYLLKTDGHGDTIWTRALGGAGRDEGLSVRQTVDGGYIVAGFTESFGAGGRDAYLVRTDSGGNALWTRTYGGADNDRAQSIRQTADSGFVLTGSTASFGAGTDDVYIIKTDANGDSAWTMTCGGVWSEYGWSIEQATDGGYVIAGQTMSFGAGLGDVYLVKTDSVGRVVAVAEPKAGPPGTEAHGPTIIRGVLFLPASLFSIHSSLFDMTGRRVMLLRPGTNDIRRLVAGVYFVRYEPQASSRSLQAVRRIVIGR